MSSNGQIGLEQRRSHLVHITPFGVTTFTTRVVGVGADRDLENGEPFTLLMGMSISKVTLEDSMEVPPQN